ncbi:uncharacterized protein LOC143249915 isoform X2 [Tachypleus tridentatus]|uniref:uncharacterized protein LOC143249915 isoform X2 n=1 Tax=Tachypleus tridentatus TaxID=6853 RepID=UPI003FD3B4FD
MKITFIVLVLTFAVIVRGNRRIPGHPRWNQNGSTPRGGYAVMMILHSIRKVICAGSDCVDDELKQQIMSCLPEELAHVGDQSTCGQRPDITRDSAEAVIEAVDESCIGTLINLKMILCSQPNRSQQ